MKCLHPTDMVVLSLVPIRCAGHAVHIERRRCRRCGEYQPCGPSNDSTDAVQDELIAIEVAAGERVIVGETSPAFRVGFCVVSDPDGRHPGDRDHSLASNARTWLRQYQSGAFAAHLMGEGE